MKRVAIVMGSRSDLPVMEAAAETLRALGVPHSMTVASAHRTPERVEELVAEYESSDVGVIIGAAGGAAHLAGAIAARTALPVIGVPVASGALNGLDALLATVQMPPGVPVAAVSIDGAVNAAVLAAQILASSDPEAMAAVRRYRAERSAAVVKSAEEVESRYQG